MIFELSHLLLRITIHMFANLHIIFKDKNKLCMWKCLDRLRNCGNVDLFSLNFFLMFIYFWDREREQERGRERRKHKIWSRLQALSCQLRVQNGAQIYELRDHDLSQSQTLNQLSHLGTPKYIFLFAVISSLLPYSSLPPSFPSFSNTCIPIS